VSEFSNTQPEQSKKYPGGPFRKGDPRINRKGRPKSFDAMRALARQIANEAFRDPDGNLVIVEGERVTKVEAILRGWAVSGDFKAQKQFLEIAFGKVPVDVVVEAIAQREDVTQDLDRLTTDELRTLAELTAKMEGGDGPESPESTD